MELKPSVSIETGIETVNTRVDSVVQGPSDRYMDCPPGLCHLL